MRNYVKYPPLEWRKRDEYCIPQGPSFSSASSITVPIAGSLLRFKAPRHSPQDSLVRQARLLPGQDALIGQRLASYSNTRMANDHWGSVTPFVRSWAFWGPWMTGCKGELQMIVSVVGRRDGFEFPTISYFHPRAFETVFTTYLNDYYGHARWDQHCDHVPRYFGPADWQRHQHLAVFSGSCTIYRWAEGDIFVRGENGSKDRIYHQGVDVSARSSPSHLFFFPITEKHFVLIKFNQHLYSRDKDDDGKWAFDTSPVQQLQDDIFNSITLELSPEAKASYARIKAEHGNMQLSKDFAPLKWPTAARTPGETVPEGECGHEKLPAQQTPLLNS